MEMYSKLIVLSVITSPFQAVCLEEVAPSRVNNNELKNQGSGACINLPYTALKLPIFATLHLSYVFDPPPTDKLTFSSIFRYIQNYCLALRCSGIVFDEKSVFKILCSKGQLAISLLSKDGYFAS